MASLSMTDPVSLEAILEADEIEPHIRDDIRTAAQGNRGYRASCGGSDTVDLELAPDPEAGPDYARLLLPCPPPSVAAGLNGSLVSNGGEMMSLLVAALDVMPAEVALLDRSGRIMTVNRAWKDFARLNGYVSEDAGVGSNYLDICDQADGSAAIEARSIAGGLRAVLAGKQSATYVEYPCDSPDEQRWFQVRASGFNWNGDRYAVVSHESLTESKRAEQQHREQLDEMAHQWQKNSLGELASGIAHELNQPLGAISNYMNGCLRRLEAGTMDREQLIKTVRGCAELAEFAGGVIKRMRGFATQSTCQYQPMALNDAVCQAMRFFKASPESGRVRVCLELAEELPRIRADEVQIQQVALNLLRNARDAVISSDCAPPHVQVSTYLAEDGKVCLAVRDNGRGLPDGVEGRLFEPFFSTKSKGMGLGLSISKTIAEVHGGRLTARNAPGGGAVFELRLPALPHARGLQRDRTASGCDPRPDLLNPSTKEASHEPGSY
ncbi:MAG: ATP-binding protein [Phycisphaerales bacterium JB060]